MTLSIQLSRIIALLGSLFTMVQIFLLASDKEGICLNDGCKVVDSLTTVPPIVINIGGFIFFQLVFWGLWVAVKNRERLHFVNNILLAGLAAEGVLVSFQHFIAQAFCSYCLIILGFIIALNLLAGMRHVLTGAIIFAAVSLSFASLQFGGKATNPMNSLDSGTFAHITGDESTKRYLFFSSTCKYCEKVIASLDGDNECAVRFNPIDEITDFPLEGAVRSESYDTAINKKLLQSLELKQIPVLLEQSASGFQIITGAGSIEKHLVDTCFTKETIVEPAAVPQGYSASPGLDFLPQDDGACAVETDCEDPLIPQAQQ